MSESDCLRPQHGEDAPYCDVEGASSRGGEQRLQKEDVATRHLLQVRRLVLVVVTGTSAGSCVVLVTSACPCGVLVTALAVMLPAGIIAGLNTVFFAVSTTAITTTGNFTAGITGIITVGITAGILTAGITAGILTAGITAAGILTAAATVPSVRGAVSEPSVGTVGAAAHQVQSLW